ncbi:MAG: hypothetical protein GTO03_14225, partial [Planctomycetales bacterium]|nr:hypothetical protein [Planctomycetales bacterium]
KTARLWDLTAADPGAASIALRGHRGPVRTTAFSPNGRWLVTGSVDTTVRLWDLTAKDIQAGSIVLRGHSGPIVASAIGPDSRWMATGSTGTYRDHDTVVRLWDLPLDALLENTRLTAARHL